MGLVRFALCWNVYIWVRNRRPYENHEKFNNFKNQKNICIRSRRVYLAFNYSDHCLLKLLNLSQLILLNEHNYFNGRVKLGFLVYLGLRWKINGGRLGPRATGSEPGARFVSCDAQMGISWLPACAGALRPAVLPDPTCPPSSTSSGFTSLNSSERGQFGTSIPFRFRPALGSSSWDQDMHVLALCVWGLMLIRETLGLGGLKSLRSSEKSWVLEI